MEPSRSEFITVRGLHYHLRHWGSADAPILYMLHGWMDVSASFQFLVDGLLHLGRRWHIIAPDWRGFGLSDRSCDSAYWFPDYLGDLEAILRHYSGDQPANLLGHSMGGNIAMIYAGVRPQRVAKLINLEGFGLPAAPAAQAPVRYTQWLDELNEPPSLRTYASLAEVAQRLQKNNPRLTDDRAEFLARHWASINPDGVWELLADPLHKRINPILYRIEEALACWNVIQAPVLWIEAQHSHVSRWGSTKEAIQAERARRIAAIPHVSPVVLPNAGHMLHHDQPEKLAKLLVQFIG